MSFWWSVARTLPRKEAFAAEQLEAGGFETLLPRLRNWRSGPVPMFSSYIFVHVAENWPRVDRTIGIMKLVQFGDHPARVPETEIAGLKARMDGDGLIALPGPPSLRKRAYAKDEKVRIVGGAFDGLAGVHSGMSAAEREIVLLTLLNAPRRVAIPAHLVRPWRSRVNEPS